MTKPDIIEIVATATGVNQKVTGKIIEATLDAIQKVLADGGTAEFYGFGIFKVIDKVESTGRNPQTGEVVKIPAHKSPHFKAGKTFKKIVNGEIPAPKINIAPATAEAE